MLYLTGGLVLGETIALWMKAESVCTGLAALLLVFSCAVWLGGFRAGGRGGDEGRRPAFFIQFVLAMFLLWIGLAAGGIRMEYEQWRINDEQGQIREMENQNCQVAGQVTEIRSVEYGVRLTLADCVLCTTAMSEMDAEETTLIMKERRVHKLYVYADSAEAVKLGMRIHVHGTCKLPETAGNPGEFDYRLYCLSKGVCGIFDGESMEIKESAYWGFREWVRQIGLMLETRLEMIAEPEDLGILKAILLGQKDDLEDSVYSIYRRNGIAHILAISGLHISMLGMGLWRALRKLGMGYVWSGGVAFGMLFVYGVMTGFGPSVVRAVFMMGVSFLAGVFGRTYDLPSAMCIPAIGLLMSQPYLLTQASFQLSFLAVAAMFVPGQLMAKKWGLKGTVQQVWISLSLQITTMPFVLLHSFEIPMFGMLLNFLVVPLMSYLVLSGFLGIVGSFLGEWLGIVLLGGAHWILLLYQKLCQGVQMIPGAAMILGAPDAGEILAYYLFLFLGVWFMYRRGVRWLLLWGIGVLFMIPWPNSGLTVTFLDVGQGDGIVLESEGRTMLVDCGSSGKQEVGADVLIPFLKYNGIGRLDTVAVTHGDQDHISGIRELLESSGNGMDGNGFESDGIEIGELLVTAAGAEDSACRELIAIASAKEIPVRYCEAGDELTGGLGKKVTVFCLHPKGNREGAPETKQEAESDRNGDSMVLFIAYGAFSMMLTGDIGMDEEALLMDQYDPVPITVLKAAHHGSANSNGRDFLEKLNPAYVIFSYGKGNVYGHPSGTVVEYCENLGGEVWKTAEDGAVTVWTDGSYLQVNGWLDRRGGI